MKKLASTFPNMVLSLCTICLTMGAILGFMSYITTKPIAEQEAKTKTKALKEVLPDFDNDPLAETKTIGLEGDGTDSVKVYYASKGGKLVGYAFETFTKKGFGGKISLMVGIDPQGTIKDYQVLSHAETPGLGAKIQDWFHLPALSANSIRDFRGISLEKESPLKVTKDGGKVDAITASTISSRAFIDAVERAYSAFKIVQKEGDSSDKGTEKNKTDNTDSPASDVDKE